jgi:hypothetical protein
MDNLKSGYKKSLKLCSLRGGSAGCLHAAKLQGKDFEDAAEKHKKTSQSPYRGLIHLMVLHRAVDEWLPLLSNQES